MEPLIGAIDPDKWQIECSEDRWAYILTKHPDVNGFEGLVKLTIEKPDTNVIYTTDLHPDRRIYYRKIRGKRAELKVVVQVISEGFGEIITAHLCSKRPSGETPIW